MKSSGGSKNKFTNLYLLLLLLGGWIAAQWFIWKAVEQPGSRAKNSQFFPSLTAVRDLERNRTRPRKNPNPRFAEKISNEKETDFYIVFSTDCSGYQHWQGILLYYSALRVQQPGTIVRIASGCSPDQEMAVAKEWKQIDPSGQTFQVHFAPSTALQNSTYKYSNKPGGLLHWLQKHSTTLKVDTVVCLLDPDMILLKPITPHLVAPQWTTRPKKKQIEYVNSQGIAQLMRVKSLPNSDHLPERVTTGHAGGQHFGVGGAWVQGMAPEARPVWKDFSKAAVCGTHGACTQTTAAEANQNYAVGPVYLATVADWHRIAATWWEFVPRVHRQYPHLLAEMYALTMAVAHLQIPFALMSSYMVTGADVGSPTEAWSWIDDIVTDENHPLAQACPGMDSNNKPPPLDANHPLPNTLHHCQRYKLDLAQGSFLFAKRKIPHDVFSCTAANKDDPVPFDLKTMRQQASQKATPWSTTERRALFALCHAVSILNWARNQYREQVCGGGSTTTT